MGDMAERIDEDGMDELAAHETGSCDMWCRYCNDPKSRIKLRPRRKQSRRAAPDGSGDT